MTMTLQEQIEALESENEQLKSRLAVARIALDMADTALDAWKIYSNPMQSNLMNKMDKALSATDLTEEFKQ